MTVVRGDAARRLMASTGGRRVSHARTETKSVWTARLLVPDGPDGPAMARRFVRTQFSLQEPEFPLPDTTMVVSELVSNALIHGAGPVLLTLTGRLHGPVSVEVRDGASPTRELRAVVEHQQSASPTSPGDVAGLMTAESGRGLVIVGLLSHRWGVRVEGNGKCVWALLGQAGTS